MLTINLLPEELKKELKFLKLYNVVNKMITLIILLTFFLTAFVVYGKFLLKTQTDVFSGSLSMIENKDTEVSRIDEIEKEIAQVKSIQGSEVKWAKTIEALITTMNSDIVISSMKIDKDLNQVSISGTAKTREALLALKKTLESNENYPKLDFPIRNLSERQNINFDIKMNLKSL